MSSGVRVDENAIHEGITAAAPHTLQNEDIAKIQRILMSPRQMKLNELWSWYRTENYNACRCDWNGREIMDSTETEAVMRRGAIPPGYYDAGATLPLKFRKPETPSGLVKLIVDRFTGLLFSDRHHPKIVVAGDQQSEDYVNALAEEAQLWPAMVQARAYGGAQGSVLASFKFVDGQPIIEPHDPRWVRVDFKERGRLRVKQFEKRYIYAQEDFDAELGEWVTTWLWYRRVVDEEKDTEFAPAWVDPSGVEPAWEVAHEVPHGLGFCPAVWIQNLPSEDSPDGDPDAHGCYDLVRARDMILSQAHKGTIANCDPTLLLLTDTPLGEILKGSENAIQLPKGSDGRYMEMTGKSIEAAMSLGEKYRENVLELASVVLEGEPTKGGGAATATEIERRYAAMLAKADVLRVQYGKRGVIRLLDLMVQAIRLKSGSAQDETGAPVTNVLVDLPPRIDEDNQGQPKVVERTLSDNDNIHLSLRWPRYFIPSIEDARNAAVAAAQAKAGGLIDEEHAIGFVAEHFNVENVPEMARKIKQQEQEQQAALEAMAGGGSSMPGGSGGGWGANKPNPENPNAAKGPAAKLAPKVPQIPKPRPPPINKAAGAGNV